MQDYNHNIVDNDLVFIDSNIDNYQTLISGIKNAEIVLLDSSRDGVEQITEQLSDYSQIENIQIISHSDDGSLQLGNAFLTQSSLDDYANDLRQWGKALNADGDLLFYGCNLAAGNDGLALVKEISQLTGADVAASNDLTGHSSLGGDWDLEIATGQIEAEIAINQATQVSFTGQLNLLVNGSFEANAVSDNRWATFTPAEVPGWQSLNGERIEIWDSGHNGVTSTEGSNHAELDNDGGSNLDAIYQDIQTQAGQTYTLNFDMRSRGANFNSDDEAVIVEWNGVETSVNGYRATAAGEWTTITVEVIGTGGSDRLLLRESDVAGASNGVGPLLDNVSLEASGSVSDSDPITPPEVITPPVTSDSLLVNGSFESNAVDNDLWATFAPSQVQGWQSLNGERIEIWDSGHSGVVSSEGTNHAELDNDGGSNLDAIYQDVQTVAGQTYTLTFDVRSRGGNFNSDDEAVVVEWNGVATRVDGYRASAAEEWTTISVEVTGTGGSDRLLLRESSVAGASNGLGPLLDNVRLTIASTVVTPPVAEPTPPVVEPPVMEPIPPVANDSLLVNGSFEANTVDGGRWATFAPSQVQGWQSLNGERIEIWDSGHSGVVSSEGTNHAELDNDGGSNLDAIYQDIQTEAGRVYNLTFDVRSRGANFNSDDEAVVVEWNGVATRVGGYRATAAGEWTTISVEVTGTGGSDRLLLRESDVAGASNGLGPLLDNVTLTASDSVVIPPEVVEPPVVEPTPPVAPPAPPSNTPNGGGFTRETLVSGLDSPIAFTYADDGRIFVTEKAGRVKIIENGQVTSTFIDINEEVNSYWDRGLMGIALDPDFAENGWVYLSYSVDLEPETPDRADFGSAAGGRLIRVQASATNPNVADLSTREVILDGHKMTHATHAVGDVDFDNDGNLIFSWGDGGFGDNLRFEAQDPDSKQGKFFRIDPDTKQGVPENPFYDPANPDSTRSKVLALGVRNPWRWTVDRPTGDIYFGEVTDSGPEEINIISSNITNPDQELNFGWPYYEDNNRTEYGTVPNNFVYQDAYVALPHSGGYDAITGGAVYRGTAYPEQYNGRYFFANFGQNVLYTADSNGNFTQFGNFEDYGSPVDIQLAPNGTIQYLSLFDGSLYQLNYDANNVPLTPNAEATASATAGIGSLTVDFNSAGSNSPNGSTLSYAWDFESDGVVDSTAANPSHTYNVVGDQAATLSTATLTITDEAGQQDTTEVEITVSRSQPNDGNVAYGKPTFQSSTFAGALSSRAVDGNFDADSANGSVAVTALEDKAFWEIDLGAVYDLSSIMFYIGEEPLSDYYILVSENEFTGGNLSALLEEDDVWSFNDPNEATDGERIPLNQRGRYLRVQLAETNSLALAEVRIFGELA